MNKRDSRTNAFELGMQNGGLASGIAVEMGRAATMGLAPAIFGSWMNISGSFLANWWRDRDPLDGESEGQKGSGAQEKSDCQNGSEDQKESDTTN